MSQKPEPMILHPIGTVKNDVADPGVRNWANDTVSEIVIDPEFEEALDGIEAFSHIIIVFWMHLMPELARSTIKVHPQRREDLPLVGVFATRSPARPNPLGVVAAKLIERDDNVLKVTGLDALNGTPVIDIKPYLPGDSIPNPAVPDWIRKLGNIQ